MLYLWYLADDSPYFNTFLFHCIVHLNIKVELKVTPPFFNNGYYEHFFTWDSCTCTVWLNHNLEYLLILILIILMIPLQVQCALNLCIVTFAKPCLEMLVVL